MRYRSVPRCFTSQMSPERPANDGYRTKHSSGVLACLAISVVRAVGLEPTRAYALQILSLICLPFHHARIWRRLPSCRSQTVSDLKTVSSSQPLVSYTPYCIQPRFLCPRHITFRRAPTLGTGFCSAYTTRPDAHSRRAVSISCTAVRIANQAYDLGCASVCLQRTFLGAGQTG